MSASSVAKYFLHDGAGRAKCRICNAVFILYNINQLKRHINQHEKNNLNDINGSSTNLQNNEALCSKEMAEDINNAVAKAIAADQLPISFCCSDGFKHIAKLFKGYTPIQEQEMKKRLHLLKEGVTEIIRADLQKTSNVAITTDLWTSMANESYITVTAHMISEEWDLKSFTLDTTAMNGPHIAENIAQKLIDIKQKWNINSVSAIVTDNATNLLNTVNMLDFCHHVDNLTCAAHTMQLIVNTAINDKEIQQVISSASKIVAHFKHSPKSCELLKLKQQQLQLPTLELIQNCRTRWNSTYEMVERLLKNRHALINVLEDRNTPLRTAESLNVTESEWNKMEILSKLLHPVYLFTLIICNEKSPISMVRPMLHTLLQIYSEKNDDDNIAQLFKVTIKAEIIKRFDIQDISNVSATMIASFLDPRYKFLGHESAGSQAQIKQFVKTLLDRSETDNSTSTEQLVKRTPLEEFYEIPTGPISLDSEWSLYLMESEATVNTDIYLWWREKQLKFKNLAKLAKQYLCIPATSASAERCFSAAGNIVTSKRSCLKQENVNGLVFLHQNKKYLE